MRDMHTFFFKIFFLSNLSPSLLIGEELGQPYYALPFLSPNATGKAILHGVNYASGGGGIMNATGRIFVCFLNYFKLFI